MMRFLRSSEVTPGHCLVDVRTPNEFQERNIKGSLNVPLGSLLEQFSELKGRDNIVLVCAAGARAEKARCLLESRGIQAHVLEGGIGEWERCGLPVERGESRGLSLERQVRVVAGTLVSTGSLLALTVDPRYAILSGLVGCGLVFAGVTDTCGLAMLLTKLPYNNRRCDG